MKHTAGIQLEMNFDGPKGNRFKDKMNNGVFQVLLEVTPPPDSVPMEDAVARFAEVEYLVSARTDLPAMLAFTDFAGVPGGRIDTVSFASALCKTDRDKHLLCVSGCSRPLSEIEKLLGHASSEGFRNVPRRVGIRRRALRGAFQVSRRLAALDMGESASGR